MDCLWDVQARGHFSEAMLSDKPVAVDGPAAYNWRASELESQ